MNRCTSQVTCYFSDGPRRDLIEHKGKDQSTNDPNRFPEGPRTSGVLDHSRNIDRISSGAASAGTHAEAKLLKESDNTVSMEEEKCQTTSLSEHGEDKKHHVESQASSVRGAQSDSSRRNLPVSNRELDAGNNPQQTVVPNHASFVMGKQMRPDITNWMGNGYQAETSKVLPPASAIALELQRKENVANQGPADGPNLGNRRSSFPNLLLREQWKPVSAMNGQNNHVMPTKESDIFLRSAIPGEHPSQLTYM